MTAADLDFAKLFDIEGAVRGIVRQELAAAADQRATSPWNVLRVRQNSRLRRLARRARRHPKC